ncbi:MAG: YdeI/OmpD-associated family protein [Saprospiraceae bacterium]
MNTPDDFPEKIAGEAGGCTFTTDPSQQFDSAHWFVKTQDDVLKGALAVFAILKPGIPVWTYFPKGSGGIQTDLTRDIGWDAVLKNPDVRWINLISFDSKWSAFCFRFKTEKDLAEEAKVQPERAIFKYADSTTKTIRLPEDLQVVLEKHPAEKTMFDALSFSNKREYVEWVITAKQAQTRLSRLTGTIKRLQRGQKNPAGR